MLSTSNALLLRLEEPGPVACLICRIYLIKYSKDSITGADMAFSTFLGPIEQEGSPLFPCM